MDRMNLQQTMRITYQQRSNVPVHIMRKLSITLIGAAMFDATITWLQVSDYHNKWNNGR